MRIYAPKWTFAADTDTIFKLQFQLITSTDKQTTGAHGAAAVVSL